MMVYLGLLSRHTFSRCIPGVHNCSHHSVGPPKSELSAKVKQTKFFSVRRQENVRHFLQWTRMFWPVHLIISLFALHYFVFRYRVRKAFGEHHPINNWEYSRLKKQGLLDPESLRIEEAFRTSVPASLKSINRYEEKAKNYFKSLFDKPTES